MKLAPVVLAVATVLPGSVFAQDSWAYSASLYGWMSGLGTTVETEYGDLETELSFSDVLEKLDFAVFGGFVAQNGRWSLIADIVHANLSSEQSADFSPDFSDGEVGTEMTLVSAYATYSVVENADLRVDLGGGLRYNNIDLNGKLRGEGATPDEGFSSSGDWIDPLVAARLQADFSDKWFGSAFADLGGFGIGDSSDLTWHVYAGVGYRFNETWSALAGYRYLRIQRDFDGRDIQLNVSGPMLGVRAAF